MSSARPLLWRYAEHRDQSLAGSAGANSWLNTFYANGPDIEAGETVLRTRLQINLTFGWRSEGDNTDINQCWYQGQTNIVGLYANPGLASTSAPPSPATGLSDGYWIQNDALTLHQVAYYSGGSGQTTAEAIYKADSGTNESFGKRGPYTIETGSVFLAWDFNSFGAYWLSNDGTFFGWMGGQARWAVLVETAA